MLTRYSGAVVGCCTKKSLYDSCTSLGGIHAVVFFTHLKVFMANASLHTVIQRNSNFELTAPNIEPVSHSHGLHGDSASARVTSLR